MLFQGEFTNSVTEIQTHTFEVNGVNSIHFKLQKGAFEHFFVVVKDPHNQMQALLSYKTRCMEYAVSKSFETTSNYTLSNALCDGVWSIQVIRTYQIAGGYELLVDFDKELISSTGQNLMNADIHEVCKDQEGWYRGDFHMHSAYSDGRISHADIKKAAELKQLDFICMSEHSTLTTKFIECDFPVISSTEITWDDEGHYNIHGLTQLPDYGFFVSSTSSKNEALDTLFQYYRKQGCLLSINHPFPRDWQLKHDYDITSFQTLEVINAPHLFDEEVDNERAIHFFDYLWSCGHYVFGIGGSDAHKKNYFDTYPIAIPETLVYCDSLSIHNILESAKVGHSYVQVEECFEVNFHLVDQPKAILLPGSSVSGEVVLNVRCKNVVTWQLIKNGIILQQRKGSKFCMNVHVLEDEYYRIQARDEEGNIILFVNPLHNMKKQASENRFQRILNGFYQSERKQ